MEAALLSNERRLPAIVILAGGFGTRLKSEVPDVPKPMAPVGGKPFLHHLLRHLVDLGFREIALSLHHDAETIVRFVSDTKDFPGVEFKWAVEESPLSTGGAILWCARRLDLNDPFFVMNGDTFFSGDIRAIETARANGQIGVGLTEVADTSRYGGVETDVTGRILAFREKGVASGAGLINAGIYALEASVLESLGYRAGVAFSLETEVFPKLASRGALIGIPLVGRFIDIGVPEDYRRFKAEVEK
jgi:D-glycero-alpha-D-manno-heptose 1-phosphate guanylyltransferase